MSSQNNCGVPSYLNIYNCGYSGGHTHAVNPSSVMGTLKASQIKYDEIQVDHPVEIKFSEFALKLDLDDLMEKVRKMPEVHLNSLLHHLKELQLCIEAELFSNK